MKMKSILIAAILAVGLTTFAQKLPGEMYASADGHIMYSGGKAPEGMYDHTLVRDVYLDFPQSDYWAQLTSNYASETEIPATMTIDGIVYDSVGVRFRGNTSYFTIGNSQKKSFAISTDFVHQDQLCMGFKNLKFNNAHEDASFMREVLYDQMASRHTPNAKANYIHLHLNGQDWGIYPNIQSLDKIFLEGYFMSNDGARFRATTGETGMGGGGGGGGGGAGWGDGTAGLNYLGADTITYQKYYSLKSSDIADPWQKLIDACQILSTATAGNMGSVAEKIDIDKALWLLASENVFTDDDSYIMKGKMDYYVYYEPETGRTTPLEYDGNSSFQTNAATSNSWGPFKNVTNVNYPLLNKLLNIPEWRQRYLAHYRTILNETFTTANANAIIDSTDALIKALVNSDPKKLYTYAQYTSGVTALKTFVANRRNFLLSNAEVAQVAPDIASAPYFNSAQGVYAPIVAHESALVQASVTSTTGISKVNLYYATGVVGNFTVTSMYDDGTHGDAASGDGIYGAQIPGYDAGTFVRYYIEAVSANAALSASYLPTGAEHDIFVYTVTQLPVSNGVVINEILASNNAGATDEAGDYEDWIELYNTNDFEVDLSGFYLSDDIAAPDKWQLPAGTILPADSYLIIWADDEAAEGAFHAGFKLSGSGETLVFSDNTLTPLDQVVFGQQTTDLGYARYPNGTGEFRIQKATFNASNDITQVTNGVVINEILASNATGSTDEAGDYEDWIELYNNNDFDVDLSGFYLSDAAALPDKWAFPAGAVIKANEYLIVWADDEAAEGAFHASFKLSVSGESVVLSDASLNVLDNVGFNEQTPDLGYARVPNGTGGFVIQATTFSANNETATSTFDPLIRSNYIIYPNPFSESITVKRDDIGEPLDYSLADQYGRIITRGLLADRVTTINLQDWPSGVYYLMTGKDRPAYTKLVKM